MLHRGAVGTDRQLRPTEPALEVPHEVPGFRKARLVVKLVKLRDLEARSLEGRRESRSGDNRDGHAPYPTARRQRILPCPLGLLDAAREDFVRALELAGVVERISERDRTFEPEPVPWRQQVGGTGEQADRRRYVSALVRTVAGPPEQLACTAGEGSQLVIDRAKLLLQPERLLEVIADDLLVLTAIRLEPASEPLVQLRAQLLRHAVVRGIANQLVPKPERILDGEDGRAIRSNQLLAHEPRQSRTLATDLHERSSPEFLADHRGAFCGNTLSRWELFEPRGE